MVPQPQPVSSPTASSAASLRLPPSPYVARSHCPDMNSDQDSESLQLQAIERARESFARLPKDHAIFIQCLQGNETISDVLTAVRRSHRSCSRKKSSRALHNFQQYTTWLRSMSDAVPYCGPDAGWYWVSFVGSNKVRLEGRQPVHSRLSFSLNPGSNGPWDIFLSDCLIQILKYADI
jgi:hypothetical protein